MCVYVCVRACVRARESRVRVCILRVRGEHSEACAGGLSKFRYLVTQLSETSVLKYRVIHKSLKHLKNSQQINYLTDHGSSYADRERNSPIFFFKHISQMLNVSTFGNTADIYSIVDSVPHACQHMTVDQSHSSGDTVAKIW